MLSQEEISKIAKDSMASDLASKTKCDCCVRNKKAENVRRYPGKDYYVCVDCFHEQRRYIIQDVAAMYKEEGELVPYSEINHFLNQEFYEE